MLTLHPNFLMKAGKKEFAVLPYDEYEKIQEILEDYEDLLELRKAQSEEVGDQSLSIDEVRSLLS